MDDALLVRGLEAFGDLLRDRDRFVDGDRTALQPLGEVFAFDQLQRQRDDAVALFEPVDRGDVRMVERREHLGLAPESSDALGILRKGRRKNLDGDVTVELRVPRPKDFTHSPGPEGRDDLVGTESRARVSIWNRTMRRIP